MKSINIILIGLWFLPISIYSEKKCVVNGTEMNIFDKYAPYKDSPCNICTCGSNGPYACQEQLCEDIDCSQNKFHETDCCKFCKGIIII